MKFYIQQGANLQRTHLAESDHVCECCQQFSHEASQYLPDDAVCERCQSLCRCACHRPQQNAA